LLFIFIRVLPFVFVVVLFEIGCGDTVWLHYMRLGFSEWV
jgi:hypothetical protein